MNTNTFTKMKKFIIMAALLPMSLFAQGNVGINTLTPGARLDVDGTGVTEVLRLQNLGKTTGLISDKMLVIDTVAGSYFVKFADMPISSVCSIFPIQGNGTSNSCLTFVPGTNNRDAFLWNGTDWEIKQINEWNTFGNNGTDPNINFLGTIDAKDLVFKTKDTERARITEPNGFVGIGTPTPLAKLHINGNNSVSGDGGILATSPAVPYAPGGSGITPNIPTGVGTRFMWIPEKSAMRFGTIGTDSSAIGSDYWNPNNIGDFSSANGYNAMASGNFSFAVGNQVVASGEGSTALGKFINTKDNGSFQIGDNPNSNQIAAATLTSSKEAQFSARFNGGFRFFTTVTQDTAKAIYFESGNSSNPNGGSIGIGIPSPTEKLDIIGRARVRSLSFTAPSPTDTFRVVWSNDDGILFSKPIAKYAAGTGIDLTTVGNTTTISTLPLGGDLIGTVDVAQVKGIQNVPVSGALPSNGQVLRFNGVQWTPTTLNASATTPTVGLTRTVTVGNGSGGTCTLTYVNGLLTATTCP